MISDAVLIAIISGFSTTAVAGIGAYFAYLSAKSAHASNVNSRETLEVAKKTETNTNNLAQQLVRTTATASHAEGKLEERNETNARTSI